MSNHFSRRRFLLGSGAVALSVGTFGFRSSLFPIPALAQQRNPNEKLNVALIGIANRGGAQVDGATGENIVALCDVDDNYLKSVGDRFPNAARFVDFREMYDKLDGKLDAVLVSTADHTHAVASVWGMKKGIHCYCEKPLAHTVHEVRVMTDIAREKKLFTQMGTQIHAENNYRRVVELIQAGAIGPVEEVHTWCATGWGNKPWPTEFPEVPKNLHWDLWLGPVPPRPYHPTYFGGNWRSYWAFGNGTLGDMACHHMDLPYWALDLKYPTSAEATSPFPVHPECTSLDLTVKYEFPARGNKPVVKLTWYDGSVRPALLKEKGLPEWGAGNLFVGKEGMLMADYGRHILFPEEKFADYKRPAQTIPNSIGHYAEWFQAIKTGQGPSTCDFGYSGPLTEAVLLGTVSYRLGQKLEWDAENLKVTNCPEADKLLKKEYPDNWKLV